ncbi:MAG: hypothetical protein ACYTFG_02495, partial [Planctomycetota bacterium]
MRLALGASLLTLCLCGQGCFSFFFHGDSPNDYAANKKTNSLVHGVAATVLLSAGIACFGAGLNINNAADPEDKNFGAPGDGLVYLGQLLILGSIPSNILSMVNGGRHFREVVRCRRKEQFPGDDSSRGIGPRPHQTGG